MLTRLRDAGDQAGWREFFDTYWSLLYRVALRSGLTEVEAQDAVQETIITVAQVYLAKHRVGVAPKRELKRVERDFLRFTFS